nr:immunoglobulin heavy chain junction region [Mus musculus]MBK4185454.1 immunoglobulin heavy chain junction region [Mus musculus]
CARDLGYYAMDFW